jgi:hypothetical protein
MKKAIIVLVISSLCSGVSFASFQVKKSKKEVNTHAITVKESQNVTSSTTQISGVSENLDVSSEEIINPEVNSKKKSDGTKDGTVAIILAIVSVLLLPFGLHNWYLGRKKQALWQTLLVIPGFILLVPPLVSWVWQIVDLIRLLANGGTL